ncbi:MAG: CBS domain-containing protein [Deltaproteobacteria bacterium]|nr:CBS domain-containing protein [Deltaproteobacteria bacterium]
MKRIPPVEQLMTPLQHTINAASSLKETKEYMYRNSLEHLAIVEDGEIIGSVTDECMKIVRALSDDDRFEEKHTVGELCLRDPYVASASTRADKVLAYMAENGMSVALITRGEKLVGILTTSDICRAFIGFARKQLGLEEEGSS